MTTSLSPSTSSVPSRAIRRVGLAVLLAVGLALLHAGPAHAEPPPEKDHVYAAVAGDSISGDVYWSSYRAGTGTVTIYNQPDGVCVTAQQRLARNGVWSRWTDIVIGCYQTWYRYDVTATNTGSNIQYWQFRVRDANSGWAYDTNSPGGA